MIAVLCVVIGALLALLLATAVGAYNLIEKERDRAQEEADKHDRCHAETAALFKDVHIRRISAEALRAAAVKYDDPAELAVHRRLANERYQPGGPSMPVIWLEALADGLDAESDNAIEEYTLSGERA